MFPGFESVKFVATVPEVGPVATTLYCATNQFGRLNWSVMLPFESAIDVGVAVPGAAPVVVHEDVDDLAGLPVRAGQRDETTGRVVVEVAGDRGRSDRLRRRRLRGRLGGGCGRRRSLRRRLFWRRLRPSDSSLGVGSARRLRRRLGRRLRARLGRGRRRRAGIGARLFGQGGDRRDEARDQQERPAARRAAAGVTGGRIGAPESSRFPAPARTAISGTATTSQDVDGAVESRTRRRSKGSKDVTE